MGQKINQRFPVRSVVSINYCELHDLNVRHELQNLVINLNEFQLFQFQLSVEIFNLAVKGDLNSHQDQLFEEFQAVENNGKAFRIGEGAVTYF